MILHAFFHVLRKHAFVNDIFATKPITKYISFILYKFVDKNFTKTKDIIGSTKTVRFDVMARQCSHSSHWNTIN